MNKRREVDEVQVHKMRYKMQYSCYAKFGHNKKVFLENLTNQNKKTKYYKVMTLYVMFQTCLYLSDLTM